MAHRRPKIVLAIWTLLLSTALGQLFDNHRGPWNIIFKLPYNAKPSGYNSIIAFWQASGSMNNDNTAVKVDFSSGSDIFKSSWVEEWGTRSFSAVRLSAYKNNVEAAWIVFDALGKTKNDWLDCSRIIETSYTDVTSSTQNYCAMDTSTNERRQFFVNHNYGGCPYDYGWMILKDFDAMSGCSEWDSVTGRSYFKYASDRTMSNWYSGNVETADAMVISVLTWDMVFKAPQGVVPPQGGLRDLWQSTDTLNDGDQSVQTLTKAPNQVYKSSNVELWQSIPGFFIESVKYSFYNGGNEVCFVVFDGRNTDKNGWFADSRILYSYWSDVSGTSKSSCSINGDGTRRFSLHKTSGACASQQAWMEILDSSDSSQTCSWDSNVQTRPYFLYSSGTTVAYPQSGNSWNSGSFPAADTMAIFVKGWRMVMKIAHTMSLSPASSVYDLWSGTYTLNEFDNDALTIATGTKTYKSSVVDNWSSYFISAVRVSYYHNGVETSYTVFDGHGTDKMNWFDCSRILYTAYDDLTRWKAVTYCGIPGDGSLKRRFFIQNNYGGCSNDAGWFLVVEGTACAWEHRTTRPYFIYSGLSGRDLQDNFIIGDLFLVSVVMDNCIPNPCQNGATCYDEGMDYTCSCTGNWFGKRCADLNGNWATWSAWSACSQTCDPGTYTRTRTCTNPANQGYGAACAGSSSETAACNVMNCIPDIDGQWGSWTSWTSCPVTCGNGTRERTRNCDSPAQSGNGLHCSGPSSDTVDCILSPCAIDGGWATWGSWSTCTKTCGTGTQVRSRSCTNPMTNYGGVPCQGDSSENNNCNTHHCSVCGTSEILCDDGSCTLGVRCDYFNDCSDGSDESSCSSAQLSMSRGHTDEGEERPSGYNHIYPSTLLVFLLALFVTRYAFLGT